MSSHWLFAPVALLAVTGASTMLLSAQTIQTQQSPSNFRRDLPGMVNYVEGQASIDGMPLTARQDGNTQVQPGQTLATAAGKVEMLLGPGVFVRVGDNSAVRLVSSGIENPTIEVTRGEAFVEADSKVNDGQLTVQEHGATASILKPGLYQFNSDQNRIAVLDGKLRVTENGRSKEFGKDHEVLLNNPKFKVQSFDAKAAEDDLYRWSSVRSAYLAEANQTLAESAYMGYGPWWGPGWYWDPYVNFWAWMPGDGFFYSPFGYPFYSPAFAFYGGGFYGRGFYGRGGFGARPGYRAFAGSAFRGGGFASRGFAGGGFHGGGGGGRR